MLGLGGLRDLHEKVLLPEPVTRLKAHLSHVQSLIVVSHNTISPVDVPSNRDKRGGGGRLQRLNMQVGYVPVGRGAGSCARVQGEVAGNGAAHAASVRPVTATSWHRLHAALL